MRLPPQSKPVNRETREDLYSGTVEPAFIGKWLRKIPVIGRYIPRGAACFACKFIPHPVLKVACYAACR